MFGDMLTATPCSGSTSAPWGAIFQWLFYGETCAARAAQYGVALLTHRALQDLNELWMSPMDLKGSVMATPEAMANPKEPQDLRPPATALIIVQRPEESRKQPGLATARVTVVVLAKMKRAPKDQNLQRSSMSVLKLDYRLDCIKVVQGIGPDDVFLLGE